jgi:hypothetical protein
MVKTFQREKIMRSIFERSLFLILSSVAAIHCGSEPPPDTFEKRGLVCEADGFCLRNNDEDHYYGAFRVGDRELQFKLVNHHWSALGFIKGSVNERSHCIMTEHQHEFISGGIQCKEDRSWTEENCEPNHKDVAEQFLQYLESHEPVAGRRGGEWDVLKGMLRSLVEPGWNI